MVKIRFFGNAGYWGADFEAIIPYDEMPKESYLNRTAYEMARANAERYEYLVGGGDFDPEECTPDELADYEAELDWYWNNINYYWEIVSEDEDED